MLIGASVSTPFFVNLVQRYLLDIKIHYLCIINTLPYTPQHTPFENAKRKNAQICAGVIIREIQVEVEELMISEVCIKMIQNSLKDNATSHKILKLSQFYAYLKPQV